MLFVHRKTRIYVVIPSKSHLITDLPKPSESSAKSTFRISKTLKLPTIRKKPSRFLRANCISKCYAKFTRKLARTFYDTARDPFSTFFFLFRWRKIFLIKIPNIQLLTKSRVVIFFDEWKKWLMNRFRRSGVSRQNESLFSQPAFFFLQIPFFCSAFNFFAYESHFQAFFFFTLMKAQKIMAFVRPAKLYTHTHIMQNAQPAAICKLKLKHITCIVRPKNTRSVRFSHILAFAVSKLISFLFTL